MKIPRSPLHVLSLAVACAILPAAASAQVPATELDEVLVTATRTDIALADSLLPAQVITRAEIERTQANTLPELLRGRAGIDVNNQGGPGKLSALFIRGSEADHVLVLVDGVRVGSASAGLTAFQDIPVEQIDRIEIVRGPRSSLYGSDAIGGVIQIFTRRDRGAVTPRFRVGIGSHARREASAATAARSPRASAPASAATRGARPAPASAAGWDAAGSAPTSPTCAPTASIPAAAPQAMRRRRSAPAASPTNPTATATATARQASAAACR